MAYDRIRLVSEIDRQLLQNSRLTVHLVAEEIKVNRHTLENAIRDLKGKSLREVQQGSLLEHEILQSSQPNLPQAGHSQGLDNTGEVPCQESIMNSPSDSYYALSKPRAILLLVLSTALIIVNVVLLFRISSLRQQLKVARSTSRLTPGTRLSSLRGLDPQGSIVSLDYGQDLRTRVLFIFSPQCGICELTMPFWRELHDSLDETKVWAIWVSLDRSNASEYLPTHNIHPRMLIVEPSPETRLDYRLSMPPQTIVVAPDGVVQAVWFGSLASKVDEVTSLLNAIHTVRKDN